MARSHASWRPPSAPGSPSGRSLLTGAHQAGKARAQPLRVPVE